MFMFAMMFLQNLCHQMTSGGGGLWATVCTVYMPGERVLCGSELLHFYTMSCDHSSMKPLDDA